MTKREILNQLNMGEIDVDEAAALLTATEAKPLRCKVSAKGALSVYGLQRMPVTLYVEQWERLIPFFPEMRQFIAEHQEEFSRKGDPKPAPVEDELSAARREAGEATAAS